MLTSVLRISFLLLIGFELIGCVSTSGRLGLTKDQWNALSSEQRDKMVFHYDLYKKDHLAINAVYAGPQLQVYLAEGTAKMAPDFKDYPFDTVAFFIQPGECKQIPLESIDTGNHTVLEACYNGVTLLMDPSHYIANKITGSIRFDYNPIWKRGFSYLDVHSSGFVRLKRTCLTIKAFANPGAYTHKDQVIVRKPVPVSRSSYISNTEPVMPIRMTPSERAQRMMELNTSANEVEQIEKRHEEDSKIFRTADMSRRHKALDDTEYNLQHASRSRYNRVRYLPPNPPNVSQVG